ncbi:hypothetical protein ACIRPR_33510 [Streptomyces griseoflavus]|uniref:hypothetical protein n=1 Tax=Streptomyces griseoflavus TaxID=35619 RepID=UPI00380EAF12
MDTTDARAQQLIAAVNEALETPTAYRDDTPLPVVGDTPPVAQPGRPPMSQKATDDSVRMISAGFLTLCAGGAVSGVLYFSGQADPTVIGLMAATPVGIAVPILALSSLVKRAKNAAPDVHHHHYAGHVDQRTVNARGVWAKNNVKGTR